MAVCLPAARAPSGCGPGIVTIRALARSDGPAVKFAFRHLGADSRYKRFHGDKPTLGERELADILAVDGWHRGGVIAFSPPPRAPIGLARYVRLSHFEMAEVAVEVVDAWQRRGLGRALLWGLREQALAAGVRRFAASVLGENDGALALARRLGPTVTVSRDGPVRELVIELRG